MDSSVAAQESAGPSHEIILQDTLLKLGSRHAFWHKRHFVLTANNVLHYYAKAGEDKAKASYPLHRLADCEVSDLYVDHYSKSKKTGGKKELVYCAKITWAVDEDSNEMTSHFDDESSFGTAMNGSVAAVPQLPHNGSSELSSNHRDAASVGAATARSQPQSPSGSFTSRSSRGGGHVRTPSNAGAAMSPLTPATTGLIKRKPGLLHRRVKTTQNAGVEDEDVVGRSSRTRTSTFDGGGGNAAISKGIGDGAAGTGGRSSSRDENNNQQGRHNRSMRNLPTIPFEVAVSQSDTSVLCDLRPADESIATPPVNNRGSSGGPAAALAACGAPRTPYEEQQELEKEQLRDEYNSKRKKSQKRTKKRVTEGTQLAVAAGATVGVAIVTAGVGLVAGLALLGASAAAGGGSAVLGGGYHWRKKRDGELVIASADYETAKKWKACLEACLESNSLAHSRWGQFFAADGRKTRAALFPGDNARNIKATTSTDEDNRDRLVLFENNSKWRPLEGGWTALLGAGTQGLRMFREERDPPPVQAGGAFSSSSSSKVRRILTKVSVDGRPCSPLKAHAVLSTSALDAFLCLMSYNRVGKIKQESFLSPESPLRSSFRIIECIDDQTDVIHLIFQPLYLFPSWTTPRDFVLYRYWRLEQDGSYIICYESVDHEQCPPSPSFVRGELHQVFTIAPHKKLSRKRSSSAVTMQHRVPNECLMTAVVQVDPKGWVPVRSLSFLSNQGYGDAFGISALLQLLDIQDAIDQDRFVPVSLEGDMYPQFRLSFGSEDGADYEDHGQDLPPALARNFSADSGDDPLNYDFTFAGRESQCRSQIGLCSNPAPLPSHKWAEPDANSFRVRGEHYKVDRKKVNAGDAIARLIAVDVVAVDEPLYSGITTHPTERLQLALQKDKTLRAKGLPSDMPPFIFVVNIVLPLLTGHAHGVFYYAIDDMADIDGSAGTPSSKLCQRFFFGDCDNFRDRTFKLIPQIVQGNFIVRKAVGSTPAIMGKKLKQTYVRTEQSLEVVLDCGSSSVATGVIRLSLGYAKTLVVDMGFLLEGDEKSFLPERILGCVRMKHVEFGTNLRFVKHPGKAS